ncbi:F-box protein At1g61340-like [Henckelia pumila]|uniref:F-box protein At1g61340-like n=1 Tax=Henckelia pumila TaxID=405737 RepID=UPI003C6E25C9
MALAANCGSKMKRSSEGYGMGLVRSSSFGRKRVSLSEMCTEFRDDDDCVSISKRQCFQDSFLSTDKSALENLPQEILIRILCGVEHDDLKRLFFVSNAIREATLIAKHSHFAYTTPRKTVGFRNTETCGDFDEVEAPNAPKQTRIPRFRLSKKNLEEVSVALFPSGIEDGFTRRELFMGVELAM